MTSSPNTALFATPLLSRSAPPPLTVSVLVHSVAFGLLCFGVTRTPQVNEKAPPPHYSVRLLDAYPPEPEHLKPRPSAAAIGSGTTREPSPRSLDQQRPLSAPPLELPRPAQVTQTLIQPDAPPDLPLLEHLRTPTIVMASADPSTKQRVVPPAAQKAKITNARPSIDPPNHEPQLADVRMASSRFEVPVIPPSTTSPLVVRGPEPPGKAPELASNPLGPPAPARIVSLSDTPLQAGTIAIPLANQSRPATTSGSPSGTSSESTLQGGIAGAAGSKSGKPGVESKAGDHSGEKLPALIGTPGKTTSQATQSLDRPGKDGQGEVSTSESAVHIKLPRDGQFGVVVVGSSIAEQYPESVSIWSGRIVYSVYVHVGMGRSWILQYSVPRTSEAAAGNTRPEAAWPYDIVRPDIAPDAFTSEAIMVHGSVNQAGRFEGLKIVLPTDFAQPNQLLGALEQWQFRPARQNGQVCAMEVLLIIPSQTE